MRTGRHLQSGFTLLELSIALAVIGIVVAGGLTMSTSMVDRSAYVQTGNQMDEIDKAIAAYVSINGKMPCPADRTKAAGATGFGQAESSCNASGSGVVVSNQVAIGMLPIRTLGLRDRYAADEYGNRYTYAVTTAHTSSTGFQNNAGRVVINDNNNQPIISDASYLVVSHGGDGKGAYRYETASSPVSCGVAGMDVENCNGDNVFRDARFNRGSVAGSWFDDTVRFKQKQLINYGSESGAPVQLWAENGAHIYNTNSGNVGVGNANPDGKLAVLGDTFGVPAIKAVHDGNGIAVLGIGQGANPSFHAEFSDQFGVGFRADNLGWGGKLFEGIGDDAMNVGLALDMSGERTVGANIQARGVDSKGIHVTASGENAVGITVEASHATSTGILASNIAKDGFMATTANNAGDTRLYFGVAGSGANNKGMELLIGGNNATGISAQVMGTSSAALRAFHMVPAQKGCIIGGASSALSCTYSGDSVASSVASISTPSQNKTGLGVSMGGTGATGIQSSVIAPNSIAVAAFSTSGGTRGCNLGTNTFSIDCVGPAGTVSDERLKTDVTALEANEGLAAIKAIHPVRYRWKHEKDAHKELGFLAQDIEKVFPDVVGVSTLDVKRDFTGPIKNVQYDRLIAPMVLAVQQLADKLDSLWDSLKSVITRVDAQEKDIRTLTVHNAALQQENALLKEENIAIKKRLDAIEAKLAH